MGFRLSTPQERDTILRMFRHDGFVLSHGRINAEILATVEETTGLVVQEADGELISACLTFDAATAPAGLAEYMDSEYPGKSWALVGPLTIQRSKRGQCNGLRTITATAEHLQDKDVVIALSQTPDDYSDMGLTQVGTFMRANRPFSVYQVQL